jgi:excisionase family DNA binding protein
MHQRGTYPAEDGPPARTEPNNGTGPGDAAGAQGEGREPATSADAIDLGALAEAVANRIADRLADRIAALMTKRYLSVQEAAAYCSLSADSIRGLLAGGKLTALRPVGGRVVIDKRELDSLLQASTKCPRRRRGVYERGPQ